MRRDPTNAIAHVDCGIDAPQIIECLEKNMSVHFCTSGALMRARIVQRTAMRAALDRSDVCVPSGGHTYLSSAGCSTPVPVRDVGES